MVEDTRLECTGCGERFYEPGQVDALQRQASDRIRAQEGLLSPDQIRAIRLRFGYSQAAFEDFLGVGPKTVGRWERGTVFQSGATDTLLRTIDEVPAVAPFLAELRRDAPKPQVAITVIPVDLRIAIAVQSYALLPARVQTLQGTLKTFKAFEDAA